MLAEILEAGEERPDLIVGASAGAINGAFLAHSVSITRARISTRAWIRDGGLSRAEFPGPLNIHTH
jgi:predicted acylesterase/phospholipase RssA